MKQERQEGRSLEKQELRGELTQKSTEQRKETPSSHSSCFLCFCHKSRDSSLVPVSDCEAKEKVGSVKDSLVLTEETEEGNKKESTMLKKEKKKVKRYTKEEEVRNKDHF